MKTKRQRIIELESKVTFLTNKIEALGNAHAVLGNTIDVLGVEQERLFLAVRRISKTAIPDFTKESSPGRHFIGRN